MTQDPIPARDESGARTPSRTRLLGAVRDWVVLAWVIVWFWVYVQTALAERFPQLLGWTRRLW
ncbi:hypothetical protein OJF2_62710 [Aquisphaera giovannonii]|uniref:Uncharacterized protein n=1 Tax=Aquisphaera giovannonii TaxID=406548 RepID=A0A5B9WCS6_9BACT|nr:hypothetical protein [Aquisphaera giovannonii]QEH37680.1 hypothetical protein OJF2_62710 [Aquisphaera giovannonii]